MKYLICFYLLFSILAFPATAHNQIMPKPQKIVYGKGQLPLANLSIAFTSAPSEEDKFAASELSYLLACKTGKAVKVLETMGGSPSILLERSGNADPLPVPGEKAGSGSRESYKISVTAQKVKVTARSSAGLFYAVQTIRQLIEGNGDQSVLPEVEIEDWPSLAYRGFMMDMSHTQLPKIEEIKRQIDFLAKWKTNQYYFYSEASIELDGYPLLMANARYTKSEVKEVIEYARMRHIDVIPNMELYGHLHDLFRLEHYADLAVIPHGGEFKPNDPRVIPIIEDWVSQISQLFPSPFFHIGFDETWLIEMEAKKINQQPEELYLKMLQQTSDFVEKQGKTPVVWADMLQKYPSIIPRISKKTVAVPWHYFPLDEKEYIPLLEPFSKAGIDMIMQSALINWLWVVPAYEISFKNTDLLIKMGKKYNAVGFINSGWTDDTQTLMRLGFPDLAYGAVASWQNDPVNRDSFFHDYSFAQYPEVLASHIEKAQCSLMEAESLIRKSVGRTDIAFFANPFTVENMKLITDNKENLRKGRLASEVAQLHIREALKTGTDSITLVAMLTGAKMLDYIALKFLYAGEINELWKQLDENPDKKQMLHWMSMEVTFKYHTRISDLLDAIMETKELFHTAWLNEYTPFRLGVALGKYDYEFQFWISMQRKMQDVCQKYDSNVALPPLDSILK